MYQTEKMFHKTMMEIVAILNDSVPTTSADHLINNLVRQSLIAYADNEQLYSRPIRWNVPNDKGHPLWASDCSDHPAVKPVGYMTVSNLIDTSGCSREEPYWTHMAMGVIESNRGKQLVMPGDWIIEPLKGVYIVLSDEQYTELYL